MKEELLPEVFDSVLLQMQMTAEKFFCGASEERKKRRIYGRKLLPMIDP